MGAIKWGHQTRGTRPHGFGEEQYRFRVGRENTVILFAQRQKGMQPRGGAGQRPAAPGWQPNVGCILVGGAGAAARRGRKMHAARASRARAARGKRVGRAVFVAWCAVMGPCAGAPALSFSMVRAGACIRPSGRAAVACRKQGGRAAYARAVWLLQAKEGSGAWRRSGGRP